jgi:gamma-glutamylcyclotransferase (GGCT)/AIG2-like uncharacterized protein YtfP
MSTDLIRFFVYGTLKPGHQPYARLCQPWVKTIAPAEVRGRLYHLPLGYPALTHGPDLVQGVLLTFEQEEIIRILDDYEQHDPAAIAHAYPGISYQAVAYTRLQIPVFHSTQTPAGLAWAYTMTPQQVQMLGGVLVADGNWQRQ